MSRRRLVRGEERDFWLFAAEALDTHSNSGWVGLCSAIGRCAPSNIKRGARSRLRLLDPKMQTAFWWPNHRGWTDVRGSYDDRIMAACLLAAMCDYEAQPRRRR